MDSNTDITPLPGTEAFRTARTPSDGSAGANVQPLSEEEARARVAKLAIEDGEPVESVFVEKQRRLPTEPLYSSWAGPGGGRPFLALANVGLFSSPGEPPLVPGMMPSLDVPQNADLSRKENRSYFVWIIGKPPEVIVAIVSDRRGGEDSHKLTAYARLRVPYHVIFDPAEHLGAGVLRAFELREGVYQALAPAWFPGVGLGLSLWTGAFEGQEGTWLRWYTSPGGVVPTGRERADQKRREREAAVARAEFLAARLRALGINPEEA